MESKICCYILVSNLFFSSSFQAFAPKMLEVPLYLAFVGNCADWLEGVVAADLHLGAGMLTRHTAEEFLCVCATLHEILEDIF